MTAPPYDPDDFARAVLLRLVPQGYRLIGESDERFAGRRDAFTRLALKHLGPRPSLVGFIAPGQDPRAAAASLADWAAANLRPTAVQRNVSPGVVVVAPDASVVPGAVPGTAAPAAVWTVDAEGVHATGRPSGSPSPAILKDADRRLRRGEAAPTIGHIDVAERTMMSGRGRQRAFALGSGGVIVLVILGFLFLRFIGSALTPRGQPQQPPAQAAGGICAQSCVLVDPAATGSGTTSRNVALGGQLRLRVKGATECPASPNPGVLRLDACEADFANGSADGLYVGRAAGSSDLVANVGATRVTIHVVVR
ncbi:MAG: hypothetical protein QOE92_1564 [Chloroflexota bacterium]|nr:hypothetical protein [Chloroflexota bacterium]